MEHLMIDIETLGTKPGCVILSVGARYFDKERIGDSYYGVMDVENSMGLGLKVEAETLLWWMARDERWKAFREVVQAEYKTFVTNVLSDLIIFSRQADCIWANSPAFNLTLLKAVYDIALPNAWEFHYGQERDYRTLCAMFPWIKKEKNRVAHNAIEDATDQATHASKMLAYLDSLKDDRKWYILIANDDPAVIDRRFMTDEEMKEAQKTVDDEKAWVLDEDQS